MTRTKKDIHRSSKAQEQRKHDFDLRSPLSQRQNQLFQDTLPIMKKTTKKHGTKKNNITTATSTNAKLRKERLDKNKNNSPKYNSKNKHKINTANAIQNATLIPCPNCKRLYNIDILGIHASQCAFLSSHDEKKKNNINFGNNHINSSASPEINEEECKGKHEKRKRKGKKANGFNNSNNNVFQLPVFTRDNAIKFSLISHDNGSNIHQKVIPSKCNDYNNYYDTDTEKQQIKKKSHHQAVGNSSNKNIDKKKDYYYKNCERDWKHFTMYAISALDYTIKYSKIPFPPIDDIKQLSHFVGITNDELPNNNNNNNDGDDNNNLRRYRIRMAMIRW